MIELTEKQLEKLIRDAVLEDISRRKARAELLDQVKATAELYLKSWKREDGPKLQISMEINPDLIEYAFSRPDRP